MTPDQRPSPSPSPGPSGCPGPGAGHGLCPGCVVGVPAVVKVATVLGGLLVVISAPLVVFALALSPVVAIPLVPGCVFTSMGVFRLWGRQGRVELTAGLGLLAGAQLVSLLEAPAGEGAAVLAQVAAVLTAVVCAWSPATGRWLDAGCPGTR